MFNINKKSQLQIQQTAFMLIAVFLFFILVGLFALSIVQMNLKKSAQQINEEQVLSSLIELAESPEFNCVDEKNNCIDIDKLIGLIKNPNYRNLWKFSSVVVLKESSFDKNEKDIVNCDDGNYNVGCDRFVIYDKKVKNEKRISNFVGLCKVDYESYYPYEKCEVGKIIVGVEIK